MIVLGLTGSIGMGKSTTAALLAEAGIPVHSADDTVHRLYAGKAALEVEALFPGTVQDGIVDRVALAARVLGNPAALTRLEALVHPLVREEEEAFLATARHDGVPLVVLDIPLLFETGGKARVDRILVVSAPAAVQRQRVLARPGMTAEKFEAILARQVPDSEKRARADYVLETAGGLDAARADLAAILADLRAGVAS